MKIRRFPRLRKDYPDVRLSKLQKIQMQLAENRLPRGYDRLTKKQKKVIRKIINGETVVGACKAVGLETNTFYRYMHHHPKFKAYYIRYAEKAAKTIEGRLDGKLGRAIRVVENAMDSPDAYFAHDAAVKFLHGRGVYRKSTDIKKEVKNRIHVAGEIKHTKQVMDKELLGMFIESLNKLSGGGVPVVPKILDAKVVKKTVKALPPPEDNNDIITKIQESEEAKAS